MQLDYPDVDRGARLAATYIVGCAVTFIFVATRLCARFSIAGVGIDDWLMLITWIVFLPLTIVLSLFSFSGGTRHLAYLAQDPAHAQEVVKMNWIAQPLAIFCLGTGKVAVAFLIVRLLNRASVWRRWSLYTTSAVTAINTVLMIVFTFVQCRNPAALWDEEMRDHTTCWRPSVQSSFSIYGASFHAAMDFFLALLPITLVWGLQTDRRKKFALCMLLGCGGLTGICASVKASKLVSLNARSDFTWETYSLFMWTGIEIILLIVCGSIPALKPVYAVCVGRRTSTSQTSRRTANVYSAPKTPQRRSYIRQNDDDADATYALTGVATPATAMISRTSQDDLELNIDYEKARGIHVTKTFQVQ